MYLFVACVCGCPQGEPAGATAKQPPVTAQRARSILSRHCGTCHLPGLETSSPRARAVFALERADWFVTMSPQQLGKSVVMLHQRKDLTPAELAEVFGNGRHTPVVPTGDEERDYASFVEQTLLADP